MADDLGRLPLGQPAKDPFDAPSAGDTVAAAFRQNNPIVSVLQALDPYPAEPGYDPLALLKGTKYEARELDIFLGDRSAAETRARMAKLDREDADRQTLEDSGALGTVAAMGAGLLDPTLLLPVGGVVRAARGGYDFLRSAAVVGGLGGLQAGVSEAALQASQEARPLSESAIAIGAGTALAGLIGGAAAGLLSQAERRALESALDLDRTIVSREAGLAEAPAAPANANIGFAAAGAAATDTRALELQPFTPKWIDAVVPPSLKDKAGDWLVSWSPTTRIFMSDNVPAKRAMADLAESALRFADNEAGVPTALGGPPISRLVQLQKTRLLLGATDELKSAFAEYRFGDAATGRPVLRAGFEDLRGRGDGRLSYAGFKEEVFKALVGGDQHAIPQVQRAAQTIRAQVLDPVKTRLIEAGLIKEDDVKGDPSWFARVWNLEAVGARRGEVKRIFADWYEADQAKKAAAKARIEELDRERRAAAVQAQRLEGRLATQERRAAELTARIEEGVQALKRGERRLDTLEARAGELRAAISELEDFITTMRAEASDPEFLAKIADLEEELAALRKQERPVTQADLDRAEKAEVEGTLTGDFRLAAEVFVGKRRQPEPPSFLAWMAREGGIVDPGGDVRQILGDKRMPGLVRTEQGELINKGRGGGLTLDQWGEKLWGDFPGAFPNGRPTTNDVLAILDDAARGNPPHWFHEGGPGERAIAVREMVRGLDELFDHLDIDKPTTLKDLVRTLNDSRQVTLEELERYAAGPAEARVDRLETEGALAAAQEARAQTKALVERAIAARRAKERRLAVENARVGEARVADTATLGRLGVLDARYGQTEIMRDLLAAAKAQAEKHADALRAKIEDEVRGWKGDSAADALAALKGRDEAERLRGLKAEAGIETPTGRLKAADKAVDRAVKRILKSDRDLTREELESRADETINRILGGPDGRLPYDLASGGPRLGPPSGEPPPRGSLNSRDFAIPTALVLPFVETDVEHVLSTYLRTVLPDLMIHQRFGDVEMSQAFRRLNEHAAAKAAKATSDKERQAIEDERKALIRDLAATRDRVRNLYGWSADGSQRNAARFAHAAKSYNVVTDLGTAALNSASDMAGALYRYGFTKVLGDAWAPMFKGMLGLGDGKAFNAAAKRQAKAAQIAVETELNLRAHQLSDVLDGFRPGSKFERGLAWAADKSQLANGQAWFTDKAKTIAATVAGAEILRAAERVAKGTATKKDIGNLAASSIDAAMARRIWAAFAEGGGDTFGRTHIANTADWADGAARDAYEAALAREADIAVVTPGLEKPLWMSRPVASLLGQFKSFVAATHERTLLAQLQQRDARTLSGLIGSVAFGMLSYRLYTLVSGKPASDDPRQWIKEGISRSGVLGWFDEINSTLAKTTSGRSDIFGLIGAGKELSRFESRGLAGTLLGPTAGKVEGLSLAIGAAARGDWRASDTSALRRLLPFQNMFWLRNALNQVEEGVNDAFGVPPKPPPQTRSPF